MKPAKSRERKCSTCKHYQPSPLWRKGWCRNPLLYDRNTNHLVEAESLACNRTFIDYWEPRTGDAPATGPAARNTKPRIAPSIPMNTVDPRGERNTVTGNTPTSGMAAAAPKTTFKPSPRRSAPPLSLVTPDYEPAPDGSGEASKATRLIEHVAPSQPASSVQPEQGEQSEENVALTAAQRIKLARRQKTISVLGFSGARLFVPLALVALLVLLTAAALLTKRGPAPTTLPAVAGKASVTAAPRTTPTGLGDASPTPKVPPTTVPAPLNAIAVNGWVQVVGTKSGLTVRSQPSKSGDRVVVLADGTKAHIIDGPKEADDLTWWKVDSFDANNLSATGWCAGTFLSPIPGP